MLLFQVHDYVRVYVGESKGAQDFAKQFLEKRSQSRNKARQTVEVNLSYQNITKQHSLHWLAGIQPPLKSYFLEFNENGIKRRVFVTLKKNLPRWNYWLITRILLFHRTVFGALPLPAISVSPAGISIVSQTHRKPRERRKRRCRKSTAVFLDLPVLLIQTASMLEKLKLMAQQSERIISRKRDLISHRNCV